MSGIVKLEMRGIEKSFPGVKALSNVNFTVKQGSVHGLCGENGAGKSTLMKILNGVYQPDAGQILIDGEEVRITSPLDARRLGIAMIFQELNYIPEITIEEFLFLGREPVNRFGGVDWKKIRQDTIKLLQAEGLHYDPTTQLKDLSVSDIQVLEILKALSENADIIIMDEPTSAITEREVDSLFEKILRLKAKGVSIIYISHKMDELFRITDTITVLRDGSVIDTRPTHELNPDTIITLMVGRKIQNIYPKEDVPVGEVLLEVKGLTSRGMFADVSFTARAGEIVGIAGLMGAGRTEVVRALFGLDPYDSGTILVRGRAVEVRDVRTAIQNGIAMLSEDRRRFGIVGVRSVTENAVLPNLSRFIYGGRLHQRKERAEVSAHFQAMNVKTPDLDTAIDALSGGNQQKVLLAKWMISEPDILILDEPTRGIDVGAKHEIYRLMTKLAAQGKAIVMVSSELMELLGMCDRIYVMAAGRIAGELQRDEFSEESIMKLATGGKIR
ncbi:MAG: sugar ABC transporter ATP-binding protein [Firmicutes bacterium]|jgi:inositol transport system ATP-binding protein|nr:sugar ABC transporter ATP-binding protein [Bacillota bacterium]